MAKYIVDVNVWGYSRGYQTWEVEADSEEEALDNYYVGTCTRDEIVRDDRDREAVSADLLEE